MKKIICKMCSVSLIMLFCLSNCLVSYAASRSATGTHEKNFWLTDHSWANVSASVRYEEVFNYSGANNKFTSRNYGITYNMTYSSTKPQIIITCRHKDSNGNTLKWFNSWNSMSIMYDGSKWSNGYGRKNTEVRTYSNSAGNHGNLNVAFKCADSPNVDSNPLILDIPLVRR